MQTKVTAVARVMFCAGLLVLGGLSAKAQTAKDAKGADSSPAYKNPDLTLEKRVDDLVSRMTLQEEASQMGYASPAIPRLGIPYYNWWSEGLHGFGRAGRATVFPQAIGAAATWDEDLIRKTATVISTEGRAKYEEAVATNYVGANRGLTIWSPNINIFRDPRWGRGQETYGEDPFLTGRLGTAFVEGIQGNDPHYLRAVSTPKHFAVHSASELLRHINNVDVSPHDLEDTYLPAFRETVVDGKADSVMCAYSAVDGKPACTSDMLLKDHLRDAWHFHGYVVSDCGAIADIWDNHHYAPDNIHGIALAIKAGTDISCGTEYNDIPQAVKDGLLTKAEVDRAVKRLFTARFRLGVFDPPDRVPYARIPLTTIDSPEHAALALRSARESMVLLKNENGTLPLGSSVKTLAVIGPEADIVSALEGNYNGTPSHPVTPLLGIERQLGKQATIVYAQGSQLVNELPIPIPATELRPSHPDNDAASLGGLTGEYFTNADFAGAPAVTRTDRSIDFDWSGLDPIPGLKNGKFSVRWTGTFTPPAPGDYRIGVNVEGCYPCKDWDDFKLYLDGKMLVERPTTPELMISIRFDDVRAHEIRLEYAHRRGDMNRNLSFGGDVAGIELVWDAPEEALRNEAVAAAQEADAIIACVGLTRDLEREENEWMRLGMEIPGFYGGDRTDLALPRPQRELLHALRATGKPVIIVLMSGSAVAVDTSEASAILEAWYPGEAGGTAIAETLAGENNPAGRLPVTFYKSVADLPPFYDYSMKDRTYRYFTGQPLFPFGFGLSYTQFAYSGLKLSSPELKAGATLDVDADVQNTGQRDGDEVVEVYLTFPKADYTPIRALRGFTRVHIAAGHAEHVHFTLTPRDLSEVDEAGERLVAPGEYTISVGGGQPGSGAPTAEAKFSVTGSATLPK
ncbi:MAG TPA: glycoside hydrolase family 3 C-terminal domain-containing protein [Candidatus Limnocylindrales bacterium]|nr:glycoside hydrolase family 3 C-terminal domain-containing protein [Candidatus Limnocylindrales bacterium]